VPAKSEMLYVTTHFVATETHSSCILLQGQAILQHPYENSIYSSPTSVAPPFGSSMYHFLSWWCINMPFGYPITIPYHI
jgi:hypothetical protein